MEGNILDILFKVDETVCWDDCLDEIQHGMENYQAAPGRGEDPESYLTPILPAYWNAFHAHNIYQRQQGKLPHQGGDNNLLACYDVGIFLVGFSTLPIVLSLAEINPTEGIYFLYSKETTDMLSEISNRINSMLPPCSLSDLVKCSVKDPNYALKIQGSSDPVQTFKRIKEVIDKVGDKRIALDLTGGKKTMLGGGFTGGAILGIANSIRSSDCDMFYVDSLEYDPLKRAPIYGTEFLSLLENPYNVYNVQSVQEAKALFFEHNYEAAAVLWHGVLKKLTNNAPRYNLTDEQNAVKKNLDMTDCYALWDAFDYIGAKGSKDKYVQPGHDWGYNEQHVHNQIDVLNILKSVEDLEGLLTNGTIQDRQVIHYAVDRYQNGIRRKESDRYDDALVRFTQVIEILCKYKLSQIARSSNLLVLDRRTRLGIWEELHSINLWHTWRLTDLIRFLFGDLEDNNIYKASRYSYQIRNHQYLSSTDYDCDSVTNITNLIKPRNNFVHVKNTPAWAKMKTNTEKLLDLAEKFLENFSCQYRNVTGLSFYNLLELHEFRQLE